MFVYDFFNDKNQISDVSHTFTFSTADFWKKYIDNKFTEGSFFKDQYPTRIV